jgi:Holliday junction resolvase RusA-like endonuclease
MNIKLIVPGEPVAKARPRWAKWGIYTPKKTVNFETQIKERFASEYPGFVPLSSALRADVLAYLGIPLSKSKKKKAAMEAGFIRPAKAPDADNIIKIFFDSLQGVAFRNDSQFVEIELKKFYSYSPRLEISIKEIEEMPGENILREER